MPLFQKKIAQGGFLWGRFPLGQWTCGLSDFQRSGAKKSDRKKKLILQIWTYFIPLFQKKIPFSPKAASIGAILARGLVHLAIFRGLGPTNDKIQ